MKRRCIPMLLSQTGVAFALVAFASVTAAAPPPAEAFASLPMVEDVDISPDGNLIAWADQSEAEPHVAVYDLKEKKYRLRYSVGPVAKLRWVMWADDETVLAELSAIDIRNPYRSQRYEIARTFSINVKDGTTHNLLMQGREHRHVTGAFVHAVHTSKPRRIVMSTWDYSAAADNQVTGTRLAGRRKDSGWIMGLYEVDTGTGEGNVIATGTQFTDDWIVDPDGRAAARSEWNPETGQYWVIATGKMNKPEIYARKGRGDISLQGLTEDRTAILAVAANDAGKRVLWTIALDGSGMKLLYEDPAESVASVRIDPYSHRLLGVWLGGLERGFHWFDKEGEARSARVAQLFRGSRVRIESQSANGQRAVVRVDGPSHAAVYYMVDFVKGTADIAGEEYPRLAGVPLGEVRMITYPARDGTPIPAFLTLPPGVEAKKVPLVVLPHGGPESHDEAGFNWWAQFLATHGYAVLQPQFRGSTGYGDAFRRAGYRQWGRLMQDDVTDGVMALIAQGVVDPARVCIVGASYGGYAALAGAAFTPDLYKCAVSVSGVSDLPEMLYWEKSRTGSESDVTYYWQDHIGLPSDPAVIGRSPARSADRIKVPVLLIHGLNDTVVPIAQSERMARALGASGKPLEFVKLPGEDHWLSRGDTRLRMLQELERFLARNL